MAIEKLNTVQTVAEEFTEVASKTNELLDEYYIRQEDIEEYEVEHFGQNKFLISIIYMSTVLGGWTAKLALNLLTTIKRSTTYRRKIAAITLGLKVAAVMVTRFADVEILKNSIALKNSLRRLSTTFREMIIDQQSKLSVGLLVLIGKFKSLATRKASISFVIAAVKRGLYKTNRKTSNVVDLKILQFVALYNGVPIEE